MSPGYRRISHSFDTDFRGSIQVRTYSSGERRIALDPAKAVLLRAFNELGTHKAVASAFGVSRRVISRWFEPMEFQEER